MNSPRKIVVVLQSSYIPWRGYFDLIRNADEFIFLDDAQYTKRDWRNRNRIKTPYGPRWLTIPVKNDHRQTINETLIAEPMWMERHWSAIEQSYKHAPYFPTHGGALRGIFESVADDKNLGSINRKLVTQISKLLQISTTFRCSSDYGAEGKGTARLVRLCRSAGATHYVSGPSGRAYIDVAMFKEAGIDLRFRNYPCYPAYNQLCPTFLPNLSIIDALLNVGPSIELIFGNAPHTVLPSNG